MLKKISIGDLMETHKLIIQKEMLKNRHSNYEHKN